MAPPEGNSKHELRRLFTLFEFVVTLLGALLLVFIVTMPGVALAGFLYATLSLANQPILGGVLAVFVTLALPVYLAQLAFRHWSLFFGPVGGQTSATTVGPPENVQVAPAKGEVV